MSFSQRVTKPFVYEEFIDRADEQKLFQDLLEPADTSRLLTIRDDADRGKSHLLRLLQYKCGTVLTPRVPVSLIPLDELNEKSVYWLVRSIAKSLSRSPFNLEFTRFRAATDSRMALLTEGAKEIRAEVDVGEAPGAKITGISFEGDVTFSSELDQDAREQLQEQAVNAFLTDLRRLTERHRIVVLIDSYEECGPELEQWIPTFMNDYVFDEGQKLDNLLVVVAGKLVPKSTFELMLGDRFERVVKSVDKLSLWEPEHVERFLDLRGLKGYGKEDVDLICAKLEKGWPLGGTVAAVEQYLREENRS